MPRGRNVGFISNASAWVIAHELGHGIAGLRHIQDIQPASNANLMDYSGATHLTAAQWQQIQNPGVIINWFDSEDEAELALIDNIAGAVLGAVLDVAMQITTNFYDKYYASPKQPTKNVWDIKWWPDVAVSAAAGFASSGVGSVAKFGNFVTTNVGKTAVKMAVETSTDFLIGVASDAAKKYLSKEEIQWTNTIMTNMVNSVAFGAIFNSAAFAKLKTKILQAFGAKVAPPKIPPVYTEKIVSEGFTRIKAKAKPKIKAKTGKDVSDVDITEKVEFSNKLTGSMSADNSLKRDKISVELSQAATEVEQELATDAAQRATTPTTPEVEDEIAAALARNTVVERLRIKLAAAPYNWSQADIDKFADDFGSNADALAKFDNGVLDFDVWKKFASLTGDTKAWVRKSVALQERIKAKGLTNEQIDRLKDYYSTHNSPSELTTFPNTSSNGIYFDEFGHPDFIRANAISERNHIVEIFMDGTNDDYNRAYSLLSNKIGDSNIRKATSNGSSVYIKINDVETGPYTWHHYQDGKSMIPVLQTIHTRTFTPHTGGRAIVGNGLVNFFDAP